MIKQAIAIQHKKLKHEKGKSNFGRLEYFDNLLQEVFVLGGTYFEKWIGAKNSIGILLLPNEKRKVHMVRIYVRLF